MLGKLALHREVFLLSESFWESNSCACMQLAEEKETMQGTIFPSSREVSKRDSLCVVVESFSVTVVRSPHSGKQFYKNSCFIQCQVTSPLSCPLKCWILFSSSSMCSTSEQSNAVSEMLLYTKSNIITIPVFGRYGHIKLTKVLPILVKKEYCSYRVVRAVLT